MKESKLKQELQDFFEQQKIQPPLDPTSQIQVPPKDQNPQEKLESLRRMLSIYIGSLIDFISKLEVEIAKSPNTQIQTTLTKELEAIAKRINTSPALQFSKSVASPAVKRH